MLKTFNYVLYRTFVKENRNKNINLLIKNRLFGLLRLKLFLPDSIGAAISSQSCLMDLGLT
jgi:hypothetical protein